MAGGGKSHVFAMVKRSSGLQELIDYHVDQYIRSTTRPPLPGEAGAVRVISPVLRPHESRN